MCFSYIVLPMLEDIEEARKKGGEAAAKEASHKHVGSIIGMGSGMMTGGLIGSVIPVFGTAIGALVGGFLGGLAGLEDKTGADNLRSAGKVAVKAAGYLGK